MTNVLVIFGGLALFLYGMILISAGLQKVVGNRLKQTLENITRGRLRAVVTGTLVTAIVQSSSIVTVTALAFVNAGLLNLSQAAGVIMGANIGTTITAQIVAFKVGIICFPLIVFGFAISTLAKKREIKYLGETILGFGILFLGMDLMSKGVSPLRSNPEALRLLSQFGKIPILGILAGASFTGIVQSSSATTGLVIAMGIERVIDLKTGIGLILGANIGTCVTALLASLGATKNAKRTAFFHLFFNVVGVLYMIPLLGVFTSMVAQTSSNLPRQIANAHTVFNVFNTFIFFFISGGVMDIIRRLIPGEEKTVEMGVKHLDNRLLGIPTVALREAHKETVRMMRFTLDMLETVQKIIFSPDKSSSQMMLKMAINKKEELLTRFPPIYKTDLLHFLFNQEKVVDQLERQIEKYLMSVSEKDLSKHDAQIMSGLLHTLTDIERIGDHINNLAESSQNLRQKGLYFSDKASAELLDMFDSVINMLSIGVQALENYDREAARKVLEEEPKIDILQRELQKNHIKRLEEGVCNPEAGIIYVDILRNLERMGDHLDNIGHTILGGF